MNRARSLLADAAGAFLAGAAIGVALEALAELHQRASGYRIVHTDDLELREAAAAAACEAVLEEAAAIARAYLRTEARLAQVTAQRDELAARAAA